MSPEAAKTTALPDPDGTPRALCLVMAASSPASSARHFVETTDSAAGAADGMPALTGVRLPLALWIVVHHLIGPGRMFDPLTETSPLAALIESAWVALTVFFAISGFVLTLRYRTTVWTRARVLTYAAARFGRIYPVYLLSLIILAPIVIETQFKEGQVLNYILLLQGWIRPSVNWNTPAWSLSSEVFFYALAPLILILVRVVTWPRILLTAGAACAAPIICRLTMEAPIPKALLYFGDFLIGVAAALVYERLRESRPGVWLGPWLYGAAIAGGTSLLLVREAIPSFLVFDTGVRIASVLLVLGLAYGGGPLVRALSSSAIVAGGRASYAIYILHVPLLWWYGGSPLPRELPPVLAGVLYLAIVLLVAAVVSRRYEGQANALVREWCARWQQRRSMRGESSAELEQRAPRRGRVFLAGDPS
jgi:peptidoglycan/LPS O-acetylase OafA/YrhL